MKKNLKQPNITLLVFAAMAAFVSLGAIFLFFAFDFGNLSGQSSAGPEQFERYFLKKDFNEGNALVTRQPNLKDMLSGPIITDLDPFQGDPQAPVVIVVYSDFLCDYCHKQESVISAVIQEYNGQVALAWKDYPENDKASGSFQAAIAGRCAFAQGKFWPYHDLLYGFDGKFDRTGFVKLAVDAELDIGRFESCFDNEDPVAAIVDNMIEANALEIPGIPYIYINDVQFLGAGDADELKSIIDAELAKNSKK